MSTYVQLAEEEPITDLVAQIELILAEPAATKKTNEKAEDIKSPSVNTPEEGDEEEDEEEEKEKDEEKGEKDDEEPEKSDEEEPKKKKKAPKVPKKEEAPKAKEDSAWMILAKENKILEVLDQAFFPNFQKFLTANETDADGVFLLAFYIIQILAEKNSKLDWKSRVTRLTALFSSPPSSEGKTENKEIKYENKESEDKENKESDVLFSRLKWFHTLYDSFNDEKFPEIRYAIFNSLLSFVLWSKQTGQVIDNLTFTNYDRVVKIWKLSGADQRDFALKLIQLHVQHKRDNPQYSLEETQKLRIQYLKSFETPLKGDDLDKTIDLTVQAVGQALSQNNLPDIHTLLTLKTVQNLSKHKDHARLLRLLTIFAKETCESYDKFYKENTAYITEVGLNHKSLLSHIRALTLCSLGAVTPTQSYESLQKALGVTEDDEIETIVLDAVVEKRVEAKIDQERSEVVFYRTSPRSFDLSSWQTLSNQLESWKENISQVLSILQRVQQQQAPPPQPTSRSGLKLRGSE